MLDMPYFMTNDLWYYFDPDKKIYRLTERAPQKARESYIEYYKLLKEELVYLEEDEQ